MNHFALNRSNLTVDCLRPYRPEYRQKPPNPFKTMHPSIRPSVRSLLLLLVGMTQVFQLEAEAAKSEATAPRWILERALHPLLNAEPAALLYGNGIYLMIGGRETDESHAAIYVSSDGLEWINTSTVLGQKIPVNGWGGSEDSKPAAFGSGVFVLAHGELLWSTFGIDWKAPTLYWVSPPSAERPYHFNRVEYSNGRFLAWDTYNAVVLESSDGRNWYEVLNGLASFVDAYYHRVANRWIIARQNYVIEWKESTSWALLMGEQGDTSRSYRLCVLGDAVVIVETNFTNQTVTNYLSTDGVNWKVLDEPVLSMFFSSSTPVVYTYFVAGQYYRFKEVKVEGQASYTRVDVSEDLDHWQYQLSYAGNPPRAFAGSASNNLLGYSNFKNERLLLRHGEHNWERITTLPSGPIAGIRSVAYSTGRRLGEVFLGVSRDKVYHSLNGFDWQLLTNMKSAVTRIETIDYHTALNRFILLAELPWEASHPSRRWAALVSSDGSDWSMLGGELDFRPQQVTVAGSIVIVNGFNKGEIRVSTDTGTTWQTEVTGIDWKEPMGSNGTFDAVLLMTEAIGNQLLLIWDDQAYVSTNGLQWQPTLNLQPEGLWFKYLSHWNGRFVATAVSHEYAGRGFYFPRWEDTPNSVRVLTSEDGRNWTTLHSSDWDFHGFAYRQKLYEENEVLFRHQNLFSNHGPWAFSPITQPTRLDSGFSLQELSNQIPFLSDRRTLFAKGRFLDRFSGINDADPSWLVENTAIVSTEFVGFGNFPANAQGMKDTGWFGRLNDVAYPELDHQAFGKVVFSIDNNDEITLVSDAFGLVRINRATPFRVQNLVDNQTYIINHDATDGLYFHHLPSDTRSAAMQASTAGVELWFSAIDRLVLQVQEQAHDLIVALQESRTVDAVRAWPAMHRSYQDVSQLMDMVPNHFPNLSPHLQDVLTDRGSTATEAFERANSWLRQ
jgi:hypothetical protein